MIRTNIKVIKPITKSRMLTISKLLKTLNHGPVFSDRKDAADFVDGKVTLETYDRDIEVYVKAVIGPENLYVEGICEETEKKLRKARLQEEKELAEAEAWFETLDEKHQEYIHLLGIGVEIFSIPI